MITVRTCGGWGNQAFQYAFGLAHATRLGTELRIDRSMNRLESSRPFNLDLFNVQAKIVEGAEGLIRREQGFGYDPTLNTLVKDGEILSGYWQNEKYFESIAGRLRRHLTPKNTRLAADAANFASNIVFAGGASAFLTVRRGDYVSNPRTQAYHGNSGLDYYKEALAQVKAAIGCDPIVFVFSDDIEWVKQNWDFGFKTQYWDKSDLTVANHIGREDVDLMLMALCDSAVIPNSTFAWWGAWLGDRNRKGVVIAPKKWFADEKAQSEIDIVPERWAKL